MWDGAPGPSATLHRALARPPCLQQLWAPARCPHGAQRPDPRAQGTLLVLPIVRSERKSRPAAPLARVARDGR